MYTIKTCVSCGCHYLFPRDSADLRYCANCCKPNQQKEKSIKMKTYRVELSEWELNMLIGMVLAAKVDASEKEQCFDAEDFRKREIELRALLENK